MANILHNIYPRTLHSEDRSKITYHHRHHHHRGYSVVSRPVSLTTISSKLLYTLPAQTTLPAATQENKRHDQRDDFYVNLGLAVRTLREELPLLFIKDLNYEIYRDDITFVDPLNTFTGIDKYKMIFWALRFHGRILFREISLEVLRIWQPSENLILIRWNLKGVPRVPWEAKGQFQATSRYKLDRQGKIYQHKVDNLAFNLPQPLKPAASVLDLIAGCPTTPNPTLFSAPAGVHSSSWVDLYRAVKEALDQEMLIIPQDCLVPCS